MHDYLSESSKAYFEEVKKYLDSVNIPYEIDDSLVRGLDYYTDTVFELVSTNENAGSQATVLAGGRYDELVSQMCGTEMSGICFECGLEIIHFHATFTSLIWPGEVNCHLRQPENSEMNYSMLNSIITKGQ